ncbi:MAG TPA: DUF1707 domain-containing protein [Streptosporangiaceae bacterium]|jgi:hypothetical protein|nr:DUF1707 domain-containing protein [Streptosporangiaceae bacterium]
MADRSPDAHSGGELAAGKLRASHHDRAGAVRRLQEAGAVGRLDPAEVDERTAAALSARTLGDLAVLVSDLPGPSPLESAAAEIETDQRDRIESELYHAKRDGHWRVPSELVVRVDSGSVILDFTEAEITSPTLDIEARVRGGTLTLITRPGIDVHTRDLMVDSGSVKIDAQPARPGGNGASPLILTVTVTGSIDVGELTARPPRRNLREWLRGDP